MRVSKDVRVRIPARLQTSQLTKDKTIKVLIAGDWHADCNAPSVAGSVSVEAARKKGAASILAVDNAVKYGAQWIIQVGDWGGTWPGFHGMVFTDRLNAALSQANVHLVWLDGNHEGFDLLDQLVKINPMNQRGQTFIRSNILYSPRGCAWVLDNKRFMTVGGAYSIDKQWRTIHESWWPQEQLTDSQVHGIVANATARRAKDKPEVDYLFTHDCHPNTPFKHRIKDDVESNLHRRKIATIANAVRPKMWWHGHMHEVYDWTLPYGVPFSLEDGQTTEVYGLADGREKDSWGILDTEDDSFIFETDINKLERLTDD